jgi:hypothetical protein
MTFDEIEIGDQRAGHEEARFHALFGMKPGTPGTTSGRSSSETKHAAGTGSLAVNGKPHRFGRRIERQREQGGEGQLGHGQLVVRDRQAAFDEVEDAGRRAPVVAGLCSTPLRRR